MIGVSLLATERKRFIQLLCVFCVIVGLIAFVMMWGSPQKQAEAEEVSGKTVQYYKTSQIEKTDIQKNAEKQGFGTPQELYTAIEAERSDLRNSATDEIIESYSKYLSDEDKTELKNLESSIFSGTNLKNIQTAKASYNKIIDKAIAKEAATKIQYSNNNSSYSYPSGNGVLTKSGGVNYFNNRKETYYSQRVLPGGGLNIPGRHVASDGTVRDGDGYICVAASDLKKGSVVETSLGTGKVYDTGCAAGTTDIYTDW